MLTRHRPHYFFRPTAARIAYQVTKRVANAVRQASQRSQATQTANENLAGNVRDTVPLTTQKDAQEYYKKRTRRLSRRARIKRAKRKRFARSVRRVMQKRLGSYQFLHANVGSFSWTANNAAAKGFLLGHSVASGGGQTALIDATGAFFANNPSQLDNGFILIQTMTMELSVLSSSTNTAPVDLDIYTLECIRDTPLTNTPNELVDYYDNVIVDENTAEGVIPVDDTGTGVPRSSTTVDSTTRGWTPWNVVLASRYWRVVKKEKVLLTPGTTTHIQLHKRFKVPKRVSMERIQRNGYLAGITTAYILQGFSVWNGTSQPAGTMYFNTEYTYTLKYEPNNESTVQIT